MVAAYELLREDERIVRRQGSGTRVAGPSRPRAADDERADVPAPLEPGDGADPLAVPAPADARRNWPTCTPASRLRLATPVTRLSPGRRPGAAPRDRRPLHRARDRNRPGAHLGERTAGQQALLCSRARCWHQATGCWSRHRPTRARWRCSGSRRPCRGPRRRSGRQPGRAAREQHAALAYVIRPFTTRPGRSPAAAGPACVARPRCSRPGPADRRRGAQRPGVSRVEGAAAAGRLRRRRDLGWPLSKSIWGGERIVVARAPGPLIARPPGRWRCMTLRNVAASPPPPNWPRLDELSARQALVRGPAISTTCGRRTGRGTSPTGTCDRARGADPVGVRLARYGERGNLAPRDGAAVPRRDPAPEAGSTPRAKARTTSACNSPPSTPT